MTALLLIALAAAWIVVFLPAAWRARQDAPLSTAERFKRSMDLIAPRARGGRWVVIPESREELARASFARGQRRRRQILVVLISLVVGSFLLAVVAGEGMWEAHVAFDASLALYVILLLEAKKRRSERKHKVETLRARRGVRHRQEAHASAGHRQ